MPPGHGQRQVDGHRALTLILEQGRDHDGLALRAAQQIIHACAQPLERFDKGEARRRVRDEDARLTVAEPQLGAQRFVLFLMAHRRQQARVELLLDVRLALDRVAQIHAHRQIHDRRKCRRETAEFGDAHRAGAVRRRDRHRRPAQHIQRHVAEELARLLVIIVQDALRDAVSIARRVRRDRHRQQVRLLNLLGLDRTIDRADVVGDALAHHVALKKRRESVRHARCSAEIRVHRAAVAHRDHERRLRRVHGTVEQRGGNVATGGDRGGKHQDQPQPAPQLTRNQQQRDVLSRLCGGLRFLFVHGSTASHSTTTICRVWLSVLPLRYEKTTSYTPGTCVFTAESAVTPFLLSPPLTPET